MVLPILVIKLGALLVIYAIRALVATGFFAWRRPWSFLACCAVLPVLLALPEYVQ